MAAHEEYGRDRKLHKLARMIRSKNAGPMWVTIDVIFRNEDDYRRALKSPVFTKGYLADLFGVDEDRIDRVIAFDPGLAIKFNLRRTEPAGSWGDEDMYGTQYYVPLVDVSLATDCWAGSAAAREPGAKMTPNDYCTGVIR